MATRGGALYLLCGISAGLVLALFFTNNTSHSLPSSPIFDFEYPHDFLPMSSEKVWHELELSWKLVAVTIISFLGSAFGTVGGVGGGGIFVPMLNLIVGFDTKSAAALSKCMITAASAASVWYNLKVPHPTKEAPIIDYDLSLVFQPVLLLGITVGVSLSVVFPYWLITVLIIILFLGTSTRSLFKGLEIWNQETVLLKEMARQQEALVGSRSEHLIDADYEPLNPKEEKTDMQILRMNLKWKKLMILVLVWLCFLLLEIVENYSTTRGVWYWVLKALQIPIAFLVFGYGVAKLYRESVKRKALGNTESVCEATVEWTPLPITICALGGLLGGTVGGLLGSGSGFIQGPLLLELGVIPLVASAIATFVMFFTSSLSVAEFYLLKRFPIPYALYLMSIALIAGFLGQFLVRKLVEFLKGASIIVFPAVIFASAFTMGVVGIKKIITMIQDQESMGFLDYCSNQ